MMRATLVILALLFFQLPTHAQEIDPSWFYRPGVTITQVHTFNPDESNFDVTEFGVDQVWDFSNERFNSLIDTTWFLDPSEMVFAEHHPSATVGRRNVSPFYDWEWYYRIENDTIFDEGESYIRTIGTPDTVILTLEGIDVVHMLPQVVQGETFTDSETNPVTDVTFQGYGTVITRELDTFPDCILLKVESLFFPDIQYKWYQNDLTKEVAVFSNTGPDPALTRIVDYIDSNIISSVGNRPQVPSLSYYINQGRLLVNNPGEESQRTIQVYDINGRQLYSANLVISGGINTLPINIDSAVSTLVILSLDKKTGAFDCQQVLNAGW